ncbi:MAG: methyl coenzyme M reductase system, component A2 [Candidatus Methanomethylophilaceae archaeon]|nr:methyl coenzyme M reductase system, component A2 [Candidatus Methanomethylophilaceae archaeon]
MTANPEPLIIVENVTKRFDGHTVLENLSVTLSGGNVLGLIGKSAAGKSVFIHMLRGSSDYAPDEGRIIYRVNYCPDCNNVELPNEGKPCARCSGSTELKEVDFWSLDERDPLRMAVKSKIAIMLQRTFALFGDKSVIENLFEALGEKMSEKEKIDRSIELLELVNMTHRTTHIARDLSGGEKQRIVLARQLAREPIVFLADEPTGTLDPQTADMVHGVLTRMVKDTGMCMVVASHWPEAIEQMADEAIWLDEGKVVKKGSPKEITESFMEEYQCIKVDRVEIGQPLIKLKDVRKYFFSVIRGVVKAVDGVGFEINEKEIFGLVGLSGAGKTTVSRMIAGITPCTDGLVSMRVGDDFVDMSEVGEGGRGRATPYIGFLHQEYTLYPFDSVLRNLTTCVGMKMPAELAKMKAVQVLKGVGFSNKEVEKILYAYPDTLSVGEKHRVALAQVLIKEPSLVILDEPTGTMDPITKLSVAKSVLNARKDLNETFIVVSHDMDFVQNCCDRVALMRGGKVIAIGKPEDIITHLTDSDKKEMFCKGDAE